jgi:hypothetical protein
VLEMTLEEALRRIETGRIVDGKTIMLLYLYCPERHSLTHWFKS